MESSTATGHDEIRLEDDKGTEQGPDLQRILKFS